MTLEVFDTIGDGDQTADGSPQNNIYPQEMLNDPCYSLSSGGFGVFFQY